MEVYKGKVRDICNVNDHIIIRATDRVSSFDRHIGMMPGKGEVLNKISEFWFNNTRHIIDNHMFATDGATMIAKRCDVIPIEFVVRAYITGNTRTSMWTRYKNSPRRNGTVTISGYNITMVDGIVKNQKLERPIVTPTTKGTVDEPISMEEIAKRGILSYSKCKALYETSLELFACAQKIADDAGYILVDTKFEYGIHNGKIYQIDESLTPDSSRYWKKSTYDELFSQGKEPEKLDKDNFRDWIRENMKDPYDLSEDIPIVPDEVIQKAISSYIEFYDKIRTAHNDEKDVKRVMIMAENTSEEEDVNDIGAQLSKLPVRMYAHYGKNTYEVLRLIERFKGMNLVWIVARSIILGDIIATNSDQVVICNQYIKSDAPVLYCNRDKITSVVKRIFRL